MRFSALAVAGALGALALGSMALAQEGGGKPAASAPEGNEGAPTGKPAASAPAESEGAPSGKPAATAPAEAPADGAAKSVGSEDVVAKEEGGTPVSAETLLKECESLSGTAATKCQAEAAAAAQSAD